MNCLSPALVKNPNYGKLPDQQAYMYVPCGHCLACRTSKSKEWALRCFLELDSFQGVGAFVTLTYDDDEIPIAYDEEKGLYAQTLSKRDLQLFIKRLRKALPYPIKYYACGEYGDETFRPHYHLIIFGLKFEDEQTVRDCWSSPIVTVDPLNIKDIRYVTGYVRKKIDGFFPEGFFDVREPIFQLFSKGLGKDYCDKNKKQLIENKYITMYGKKHSLPRYFVKKLFNGSIFNFENRVEKARKEVLSLASSKQREANMKAKYSLYKKEKI